MRGGSKAVWNFSKNSSALVEGSFPYIHLKYFLACEASRDKKRTHWNSLLLKFLRFCGKTKRSLIIPSIFGRGTFTFNLILISYIY